ncbi:sensor domain-containing diguanylate cyclase [Pseudidiomarina sp. CB1]|uniref:sensor domain-containing diguanylate cyclase n=1 Tax=Pseudidiomarina sp. CB1 TaxID=2972484 RepID=UPI0021634975|nr:sensor domain-containing diguanylate cyclase [Pseudidiomarina sp. CB1]
MPHPKLPMFEALGHYMDLLMDAICVVNTNNEFVYISAGGERVFGYPPQEMIGRCMFDFIHPDDQAKTLKVVNEIVAGEAKIHFENRYIRKNGDVAHIVWSARYSPDDDIRIAVARDVTAHRQAENQREELLEQLQHSAHHDSLTGLPNRNYFYRQAELLLASNSPLAVAYIDLNHFKDVNDRFGHAIGDEILRSAARRLKGQIRNNDTIARIGGDEFVALFADVGDQQTAKAIVQKLHDALKIPIQMDHLSFGITASVGCVISRAPHPPLETLLQQADTVMYKAKHHPTTISLITLL